MISNSAKSSAVDVSLAEPVVEIDPEPNKEDFVASIQTDKDSAVEIRLVLTKCDCEKESLESKVQENEPGKLAEAKEESIAVRASETSDENCELVLEALTSFEPLEKNDEPEFRTNNWRLFTSILPGLLLLLTIGAHTAFTIYELDHLSKYTRQGALLDLTRYVSFRNGFFPQVDSNSTYEDADESTYGPNNNPNSLLVIVMWFVGAIIGNILGATFLNNMKKRTIYYLAALLQILAGILFFLMRHEPFNYSLPIVRLHYQSLMMNQFTLGVAARLVSGIVCGLVRVTVTVHASDFASKRMRRVISYAITLIIAFSTLLFSIIQPNWYRSKPSVVRYYAAFDFIMMALGLLTLLLNPLLTNETVPYYLSRDKVAKAQKKFAKLNSARGGKHRAGTLEKFNELQLMVQEDKKNGRNIFSGGNLKPIIIVLLARLLSLILMSESTRIWVMQATVFFHLPPRSFDGGYFVESSAMRIGIGLVTLALSARFGRHKFFYVLAIAMSVIFGGVSLASFLLRSQYLRMFYVYANAHVLTMWSALSLGLDYYQQEQSMDAFTVTKKAWSLATVALFEHVAHAALIVGHIHNDNSLVTLLIVLFSAVITVGSLSTILLMIVPETRKLSLRETRNKFNYAVADIVNNAVICLP